VRGNNKFIVKNQLSKYTRPFLQPLAMILVCLVFVLLIMSFGLMDLGRLDQVLVGFMETRGLDTVGKIEKEAQANYSNLIQISRGGHGGDAIISFTDETFLAQETLINNLINLMRKIDKNWTSGSSEEDRRKLASAEGLWLLIFVDEEGKVIFQNRPAARSLLNRAAPVIDGRKEVVIDLFGRSGRHEKPGIMALRRDSGKGTILIAIDDEGIRYQCVKYAMQRAAEEVGLGQGIAYIAITDLNGSVLGLAGEMPEDDSVGELSKNILMDDQSLVSRKVSVGEKGILEVLAPIRVDYQLTGIVRVGLERDRADQILSTNRNLLFISMGLIIFVGLLSIWFIYQNQNRHLARIEEMSKRLQQSERLSALGQLAAGVAHEIRNPLNAISMASQRLEREYLPEHPDQKEEFHRITVVIGDEIRRLNGIIEDFLAFSRSRKLELRDYPVGEVLQKIVRLVDEEARARGISVRFQPDGSGCLVSMDMDKLQQAFLNIVKNAMESITGQGQITVTMEARPGDRLSVRIEDTGAGMTPGEIERIFNPEYTTKEKGLGLGLSIAHEIIRGHGGEIHVESRPGSGTTFDILLPVRTG
jgi:signal transduction histidine kinase